MNDSRGYEFLSPVNQSLQDGELDLDDDNELDNDPEFMPRRMNVSASKTGGELKLEGLDPTHVQPGEYEGRDARNEIEKAMRMFDDKPARRN